MIYLNRNKLTERDVRMIEEILAKRHTAEVKMVNGKLIVSEVRRKVKKALDNA